jgi:hypothetical protein
LTNEDLIDQAAKTAFKTLQAKARVEHASDTQPLLVPYVLEAFLRRLAPPSTPSGWVLNGGMLMAANNIR